MGQKKMRYLWVILGIVFLLWGVPSYAQELEKQENKEYIREQETEQQIIDYQVNFFNWEEINTLQEDLKDSMPALTQFNLKEDVIKIIKGEKRFSLQSLLSALGKKKSKNKEKRKKKKKR